MSEGTTPWREKIRICPNARRNTGTLRTTTEALVGRWVAGTALDALQPGLSDVRSLRRRVRCVLEGIAGFNEGNSLQDRAALGQGAHPEQVPNAYRRIAYQWTRLTFGMGERRPRMIRRFLLAAIFLAAPVCQVSAQDAKVSVDMIGIGGMSCAHWRSTHEHLLEGTVWIYGFWTGLNYVAAASDQTQAKIDPAAIVNEVEKTCAQQPSQTLASAVWTTYLGSKK
jgi:hypothetical protein